MPDFGRPNEIVITNAGGTKTITVDSLENFYIITSSGTATLAADCDIVLDVAAPDGTTLNLLYAADTIIGIRALTVCGTSLTAVQARKTLFIVVKSYGGVLRPVVALDFSQSDILETAMYVAKSVTLAKMADATRGMMLRYGAAGVIETFVANTNAQILIGNGTDIVSVPQSGHVLFLNTGQSVIQAAVIIDSMISAAAAIARSKVAVGTADHVVINSGTGALSSEAQLAASRGGWGIDTSASTGFPVAAAGVWSVGSLTVDRDIDVSFEAAGGAVPSVGDFKIKMGFAGTLTRIYAFATKVIAGTDNGTIQAKNNGGSSMANGLVTFVAADPRGTNYTVSPTTNNTFVEGDELTFTTAKATAGGTVSLSLKFTRTA